MKARNPDIDLGWVRERFSYDPTSGVIMHLVSRNSVVGGQAAGSPDSSGYLRVKVRGTKVLAHRLAWYLHFGKWPEGQIDHINRDRTDNRLENLRDVDGETNAHNTGLRKNNRSGVTGVRWRPQMHKWQATISRRGQRLSVGHFETLEEAAKARQSAEQNWAVQISQEAA